MPGPAVTEAICLAVQKYSETSKIAILYTRAWGRISVIAKGAFRPKSQFWGHLEPLSIAECVIYKKPTERLQLLSSCRAIVPWMPLTGSLKRAAYGFAIGEFLYRHTYEESDVELFGLACDALQSLTRLPDALSARQFWGFLMGAVGCLGFRPVLDVCDGCGRQPGADQRVIFDAVAGKIICRQCRREGGRPHVLSPEALNELIKRQSQPILDNNDAALSPAALDEIAASIEDFTLYHLGGNRLRSLGFARRVCSATEG
jgi:DNA repair protein RecO (recombination protein O)